MHVQVLAERLSIMSLPVRKQPQQQLLGRRDSVMCAREGRDVDCCVVEAKTFQLRRADGSEVRGRDGKPATFSIRCEIVPEENGGSQKKTALKSQLCKDVQNKVMELYELSLIRVQLGQNV